MIMKSSVTVSSEELKDVILKCRTVIARSRERVMAELYVEHRRRLAKMGMIMRFIEWATSLELRRHLRDRELEEFAHDSYVAHLDALEAMANVSDNVNLSYDSLITLGYFARVKGVD